MSTEAPFPIGNPWDNWSATHRNPKFQVQTSQGETIELNPRRLGKWDWSTKYLTTSCKTCPLFVSPSELNKIVEKVRQHKMGKGRFSLPQNPLGICIFGRDSNSEVISKFLIENPHNETAGCSIGEEKIKTRVDEMRDNGRLIQG